MKRELGLFGVLSMVVALTGCSSSKEEPTAAVGLDTEQATLVAALAANADGSDEAWTSASGDQPFVVESCGFDAIVAQVVAHFDTDGSGDLNEAERAAVSEEFGDPTDRLQILMSVYDTDGSGSLEASELAVLKTDLEARCQTLRTGLLERFDTNGDGALDASEREAIRTGLRDRFGERHAARIGEFDRNGDGSLGPLERRRAGERVRERVEERRAALADQFDADQNGELDATERAGLAAQLRKCVRAEEPLMPTGADQAAPDAGAGN
jgi:Ca2+-binding EF-hand superfamily protein